MFVPVGGGPLGGVRGRGGGTLHWTLRWLPLPVVTHALPRDERLPCVDLLTLPPSVLKARGIADVTHTSLITHVHVCGRERLLHTCTHEDDRNSRLFSLLTHLPISSVMIN